MVNRKVTELPVIARNRSISIPGGAGVETERIADHRIGRRYCERGRWWDTGAEYHDGHAPPGGEPAIVGKGQIDPVCPGPGIRMRDDHP